MLFNQLSGISTKGTKRTDDVRGFGGSWGTIRNSTKEVWIIGCRDDTDAKRSGEVKEYDSVDDGVECWR